MEIDARDRDVFPKAKLGRTGYLADRAPLCRDVPRRAFLRKNQGRYVFRGKTKVYDANDDAQWDDVAQFSLESASLLRAKLCAAQDGACAYPSTVVLEEDLVCEGYECDVDTVKIVEVNSTADDGTAGPFYYAYVPNACADLAFYQNPTLLRPTRGYTDDKNVQCADPLTTNAIVACCDDKDRLSRTCAYPGERATFATAVERCEAVGETLCDATTTKGNDGCRFTTEPAWRNATCQLAVQVGADGFISAVHTPTTRRELEVDSGNAHPSRRRSLSLFRPPPPPADDPRPGRGVAATRLHGRSTS